MDWTSIIEVLIGTSGITGLFIIAERKTAAALRNMQTMFDALQQLYDKLQARYDVETDKVGKLYEQLAQKNDQLDTANTKAAVNEILRCENTECPKRVPPLGSRASTEKEVEPQID